jgi:outer membrane receptor protein involved in Fe transport
MGRLFFCILVTLLCCSRSLQAQVPQGMPPMDNAAMPGSGHIYGKITDSTGKPLGNASVMLFRSRWDTAARKEKDILLKGLTTKSNGKFSFEELPLTGRLKLRISMSGFEAQELPVSFMAAPGGKDTAVPALPGGEHKPALPANGNMPAFSSDKDMGTIRLMPAVNQLSAVTVTASAAPLMKLDIDKKVFNVEKNLVSAGGTALDVMRNVPSINVDIDGNITLRNSTPQLYIDGRPTTLTADQIPADAIESVEVITNPSAKYDASGGTAGILNIVLKKNRKTGYNGNLRAGIDKRGALNGGGDLNLRQGKFNFSGSVMANQMKDRTTGTTSRVNLTDPQTAVQQNSYDKNNGAFVFGKLGVDYFMNDKTTLSVSGIKVHGSFKPYGLLGTNTDSLLSAGKVSSFSERYASTRREFNAGGLQLGMKHLFAKEGEQLTADLNYFSGKNTNNALYVTDYYSNGTAAAATGQGQQQTLGTGNDRFLTLQTDYVKPFSQKTKLEAGLRASLQKVQNETRNYLLDPSSGVFEELDYASTRYKNNNNVYAAYVTLSSTIKNFGYQVGLRAERSNYNGELLSTGERFSNSYPISLFPSVFLSQKLKNNQELQLSVTRRINRPNFFQLIPYTDYSDSLNITRGNPALVPEFTQSFEFSYMKTFKGNNTFLASAYYKRTSNLITRYLDTTENPVSQKTDIINTYINAHASNTMGMELTLQNNITRWWDMSTNLNLYHSEINTGNLSNIQVQQAMWSWFGKLNSNFKLPGAVTLQLTGTYQSKTNLPVNDNNGNMGGPPMMQSQSASQGYIKAFYGVDVALKKTFLKNNAAAVTLSFSDIFRSRINTQYAYSDYFTQVYSRLRNPQMIKLNFSYRFGKIDASLFKRKNTNNNSMDVMQNMQ